MVKADISASRVIIQWFLLHSTWGWVGVIIMISMLLRTGAGNVCNE